MYKLYGTFTSRTQRVAWMLEEIGAEYEVVPVKQHSPEVLAVNPAGKIPTLEVDGDILTDSTAIMTFLGDRHEAMTYPAGSVERGRQDAMTCRLNDEFDAVLWAAARLTRIVPEELRVPDVVPALHWDFERNLRGLERDFAGPFLLGDRMTLADILATHCLLWAGGAKFPVESEVLKPYLHEMTARPAYAAARAKMGG